MSRPKLLDLFACEGGASVGYERAGFDVYAVDLDANRLKRNPHAYDVADALVYIANAHRYDAIHASPRCRLAKAHPRRPWGAASHGAALRHRERDRRGG